MLRPQAAVSVQLWALALGVLAAFLFGVRRLALPALQLCHITYIRSACSQTVTVLQSVSTFRTEMCTSKRPAAVRAAACEQLLGHVHGTVLSRKGEDKLCLSAQASVRPLLGCSGGAAAPKPLPLSAALCARTSPPAAAVSAAAPNAATDVPPEQLWVPPVQPRDRYTAAGDFFPYARPPPPGFQRWLDYAQPRECLLGRYDRMEADLAPFRCAHDSASPLGRQQQCCDLALCLGVGRLGWQRPASTFC